MIGSFSRVFLLSLLFLGLALQIEAAPSVTITPDPGDIENGGSEGTDIGVFYKHLLDIYITANGNIAVSLYPDTAYIDPENPEAYILDQYLEILTLEDDLILFDSLFLKSAHLQLPNRFESKPILNLVFEAPGLLDLLQDGDEATLYIVTADNIIHRGGLGTVTGNGINSDTEDDSQEDFIERASLTPSVSSLESSAQSGCGVIAGKPSAGLASFIFSILGLVLVLQFILRGRRL
jgi:hypothetical protein